MKGMIYSHKCGRKKDHAKVYNLLHLKIVMFEGKKDTDNGTVPHSCPSQRSRRTVIRNVHTADYLDATSYIHVLTTN